MDQEQYRRASSVAQAIVGLYDKSLAVDGKWGSFSMNAYNKLGKSEQSLVDNALNGVSSGTTVKALFEFRQFSKKASDSVNVLFVPSKDDRWVSTQTIDAIIRKVSLKTSVSENVLKKFLDLEAAFRATPLGREYDRLAVNKSGYSGLFQFDSRGNAWAGAAKSVTGLASFSDGWRDAYQNTLAAAGYILTNTRAVRMGIFSSQEGRTFQYKGPITANIAYLMHNQGALGMMLIIQGRKAMAGVQSDKAVQVAIAGIADSKTTA